MAPLQMYTNYIYSLFSFQSILGNIVTGDEALLTTAERRCFPPLTWPKHNSQWLSQSKKRDVQSDGIRGLLTPEWFWVCLLSWSPGHLHALLHSHTELWQCSPKLKTKWNIQRERAVITHSQQFCSSRVYISSSEPSTLLLRLTTVSVYF